MGSILNNKIVFLSVIFGSFCTSLFSQTTEKIEKIKPIKISNLTSCVEEKSAFIRENKIYRFVDFPNVIDYVPNNEEATTSEFNLMRRGEVYRLASRSLYDMVIK